MKRNRDTNVKKKKQREVGEEENRRANRKNKPRE